MPLVKWTLWCFVDQLDHHKATEPTITKEAMYEGVLCGFCPTPAIITRYSKI